ncbi:hypothetical protein ABZ614_06675 [Streptomyces sp. NPDC013178]|uniref:hypothetical protein n=1 Tax=Streptomyces sp. NPDC013178 TaxID=3155118 RepID=UPI0033C9913C
MLNLVFAVFALMMATVATRKRAMWVVLCVAVPRFAVASLFNFTGAAWLGYISGAFGLLLAGAAMSAAFALVLEDMRGEEVLPVGRRARRTTPWKGTWRCSCPTSNVRRACDG